MTALLDDEELLRRLGEIDPTQKQYQHIRPFYHTADSLFQVLTNPDQRFMLGLEQIDVMTRGFGKKELVLIVGFAHAGKTQLINTMILNNLDKRILFFSLDDPAEMILTKLVCMKEGYSAEELEERVRTYPAETGNRLRHHAAHTFGNLLVPDESLPLSSMGEAVSEATDFWGAAPQAIVIDYLQLLPSDAADYEDTKKKSQAIKQWVKSIDAPVIVLHQNNRIKGGPGEVISMLSGAYGGEQEATFMFGARRKFFDESLSEVERNQYGNTITLHLVKNKRPPGRLTPPTGIDFYMNPDTGIIERLQARHLDVSQGVDFVAEEVEQARRIREVPLPYKDS